MHLDLAMLLEASSELGCLEDPFTEEEIDQVIQNLPIDKSPGPDGFNTDFIKKCWPIIKRNFYNLCHAFHSGNLCLQSINGSLLHSLVSWPVLTLRIKKINIFKCSII